MTTDQIAQLDLIIARISFYKSAAQLFQSFLNGHEWPDFLLDCNATATVSPEVIKDMRTVESFKQVIHSFGEFYFSKAIDLELDLKRKRKEFSQVTTN